MGQALVIETAPEVMNTPEERTLAAWQDLYPDRWLLVEVTHEEDGEPFTGRLLAVASTDIALVPLWQAHTQQGKITALLYGRLTDAGPTVVA
jgi:nicotinamidase-related amidase